MDYDPRVFLDSLPDPEDVQERINARYDELFTKDDHRNLMPYVCTVCDEYLMRKGDINVLTVEKMKKAKDILSWSWLPDHERIPEVEEAYRFQNTIQPGKDQSWLNGMGLSPRGSMYKFSRNHKTGFTCCGTCKAQVEKLRVPRNAIINRNHVGCAPQCLRELTEVELAFLSPVHSYGYCFSYQGGSMKCVKGTLVFMRVKERQIAKAVTTLNCMGLNNNVVVLVSGKMTAAQKQRVKTKCTVRTEKLIAAVEWLIANNKAWKDVDIEELKREIVNFQPIVMDKSTTCKSTNANVEKEEVFTCYYPDSSNNAVSGGFDTPGAFKEFVKEMTEQNFDIELKAELEKAFVQGGDDEILLGAAILQFPYGVGGLEESRQDGKSMTSKPKLDEFMDHLSKKSSPEFQSPLFQLIMYTMKSKARLLKTSSLQLRNKTATE